MVAYALEAPPELLPFLPELLAAAGVSHLCRFRHGDVKTMAERLPPTWRCSPR
jgi:hypothetical protein